MVPGPREGSCTGWAHSSPVPTANLTGHEEKVSVENFELLKVLGTGGEDPHPPGRCPREGARGLPTGTPAWAWARQPAMPPTLSWLRPAAPPCRARVCIPLSGPLLPPRASRVCQHPWVLAALRAVSSAPLRAVCESPLPALQTPSLGLHVPSLSARTSASLLGFASSQISLIFHRFAHAPPPLALQASWSCRPPSWFAHPLPGFAEHLSLPLTQLFPPICTPFWVGIIPTSTSLYHPSAHGLPPAHSLLPQPTGRCSWCGRRAGTTQGSCMP